MKRIAIWLIGILVILTVLSVAKDVIVKASVERAVGLVTGLRLSIGNFKAGVIPTLVDIKGLILFNPAGFKDRVMMDMPEIYVKYDLPSIMRGKIHLPKTRLNMREFTVVKNERGELNLNSLKVVEAQKEGRKPSGKKKAPSIQIDSLELKIGRVIYKDYSAGGQPAIKEFDINIDERHQDIKDAYGLVSLIVVRSLRNTAIANLANFDLHGLGGTVAGTIVSAKTAALVTATQAQETVKTTTKIAAETAKGARETVKTTTEALKSVLANPFGSEEKE